MTLSSSVFTMALQFIIHIKMQINRINRPIKAWPVTKDLYLKSGETSTDEFWQEDQLRVIKALCERGAQPFSSSLPQVSADSDTFRGEKRARIRRRRGEKKITQKTDVVSGERKRQRVKGMEVK